MFGVLYRVAAKFLRWFTEIRSRSVRDGYLLLFGALFKAYRICTLWIVVFVMEKLYQQAYVERVFLADDDATSSADTTPPSLDGFVAVVMAAEAVTAAAFFAILGLLRAGFQSGGTSYVVDTPMLTLLATDYVLSTAAVLAVGGLVSRTVQDGQLFRYGHDGLRGVRANAIVTLKMAMVIVAIPFFLV